MISKPHPQAEEYCALPFPGRLGRGIRVAVIDSGVNPQHPHIGRVAGGVAVLQDGRIEEGNFIDQLGHGTAVMAAMQEKAPAADYFAVRLFDTALRAKTSALLRAIEWAVQNRMHLVNLSLGTRNLRHLDAFKMLVRLAAAQGATLVGAREADGEPCLPGSLPEVIGVALDWSLHRNAFRLDDTLGGPVFQGSGYPRPIPGMALERNLNGISFAVANITGFAARACEGMASPSFESLLEAFSAASISTAEAP